jgi:muramidase (phage lysozyme)
MNYKIFALIFSSLMGLLGCRPDGHSDSGNEAEAMALKQSAMQAAVGGTKATNLPKEVRAFLDVIAYAEGTGSSYNIRYGGQRFTDLRKHPRIYSSSPWGTPGVGSDAAGRYQFLSKTWDDIIKKVNLADFSPANQDHAAVFLIKKKSPSILEKIKKAHIRANFVSAIRALNCVWASLPPACHPPQKVKTEQELWTVFQQALKKYPH